MCVYPSIQHTHTRTRTHTHQAGGLSDGRGRRLTDAPTTTAPHPPQQPTNRRTHHQHTTATATNQPTDAPTPTPTKQTGGLSDGRGRRLFDARHLPGPGGGARQGPRPAAADCTGAWVNGWNKFAWLGGS